MRLPVDWNQHDYLLGILPDSFVAKVAGCGPQRVRERRISKNIPKWSAGRDRRAGCDWPPEHVAALGLMPDAELALVIGVSKQRVHQKRTDYGIASFRSAQTLDLDANAANLPPVSPAMRAKAHRGWLLREIEIIGQRATTDPDTGAGQISHMTAAALIDALPEEPPILQRVRR